MVESINCYNSAGEVMPEFRVCNPNNGTHLCCVKDDICQFKTGLCQSSSGDQYQGGCTDSSYGSSDCPTFCTDLSQTQINLCNIPLGFNATLADRNYCCDGEVKGRCCTDPQNQFHFDEDGTVVFNDGSKARFRLNTGTLKTFATLAGASRPFEPISEPVGPSFAFSTIEVTITSSDPSSPTFSLDTPFNTSQSEAGPFPTSTTTSVITEARSNQADSSNIDRATIIGATVGGSLGTIAVLLGLLYLFHRRASGKRRGRRSAEGRRSTDKSLLRVTPDENDLPPYALHDAGKPLARVTKDQISSPTLVEDESTIPEGFRRNPKCMAVDIGRAIEMNSAKHLSNGVAQPDGPKSPQYLPGTPLSMSFPPRAKTKPKYHSLPSSPTSPLAVSPSYQYTDQPVLPTAPSVTPTPSPRLSLHPISTPLLPPARLTDSFESSLLRSSTFFRSHHHKPLGSNPVDSGPIELFDLQPNDYNHDLPEQHTSLSPH